MADSIENPVKHWLPEFLVIHRANFSPSDWPAIDSEEWRNYIESWFFAFDKEGVDREEAIQASRMLTMTPPSFRRQHIEMVMQEVRRERVRKAAVMAPESRESAEAHHDTQGCQLCGKTGLVVVYHKLRGTPEGGEYTVQGEVKRGPTTIASHCECPLGRWIRQNSGSETRAVTPSYSDVRRGLSQTWQWKDPSAAKFVKEHGMIHTIGQLRALFGKKASNGDSKGPKPIGELFTEVHLMETES